MCQIGFSLLANYPLPMEQVLELLKEAGFSAVSPLWSPELDLAAIDAQTKALGMTIQSLHAPHKRIQLLWEPDTRESVEIQENILRCIDACARYRTPTMVIHGWQGLFYTFSAESLDFRFFDRMVAHAQQQGVRIAFENLEGEEYLLALLERYADQPHVGFCWDSGHDHCYPHRLDFLKSFGHRLIMTHLNDNYGLRDPDGVPSGNDDLHLLPYDGNICWEEALRRLSGAPRQAILNFELKRSSHSKNPADLLYQQLPVEEFVRMAGQRARRIAQLYQACIAAGDGA